MTGISFAIFITLLIISFVIGFFVGKRHGVELTASVIEIKGKLTNDYKAVVDRYKNDYKGIVDEYKKLKKRL